MIANPLRTNGVERLSLSFTFYPNGTSTSPLTIKQGHDNFVASVIRTATAGTFTVTLSKAFSVVLAKHATVQSTTAADLYAQVGDVANEGTSTPLTVVVRLLTGATPTDLAANANNSVSVTLELDGSNAAV